MPHFDAVIMNPPYNCYFLHTQICNEVRKHAAWNCILDENRLDEIQKFFDWLNTTDNEIVQVSKHIFTIIPPRYNINKLWEIYQNEKEG